MALTKRDVDAAEYPYGNLNRRYIVPDEGTGAVPGFGVRIFANGRKVYTLRYLFAGRRRLMQLGEVRQGYPVHKARQDAADAKRDIRDGIDPLAAREKRKEDAERERQKRRSIADLAEAYMDDVADQAKASTLRNYRQLLDTHILPRFGKRRPDTITVDDVRRFKRSLKKTPYVFNRAAFLLRALLDMGGVSPRENPARGGKRAPVKRYQEARRSGGLTASQVARLGDALRRLETGAHVPSEDRECTTSPHAAAAIRMLAVTGARVKEILNLRHDDVDRERGYLVVREHKTSGSSSEPKVIPLTAPVLAIIDGLPRTAGHEYIFEGARPRRPLTDLRRPWQRACELAGLDDARLHDLRHTVGSVVKSGGLAGDEDRGAPMPLRVVGGVLGHKSMQSADRYGALQDETTRAAAAAAAERIAAAMQRDVEEADVIDIEARR